MGSVRTSIIRETSTPTRPPTHSPDYTLVREEPLFVALLSAIGVLSSCASHVNAPKASQTGTSPVAQESPLPTGMIEAAHFDDGYLQVGSGPRVVDVYLDPMCPYCKMFEQGSGSMLVSEVMAGKATVRIHPLAILNRLSRGTDYSTRAAALLTAVAAAEPGKLLQTLAALFEGQPEEGSSGLTNAQLIELAADAGDVALTEEDLARYVPWVNVQTARASVGPLASTTQLASITRVPTVIVNAEVFDGISADAAGFRSFYAAQ